MATKEELIEVKWAAHSDPSKVGKTEKLRPREARAAVRTGQAQYVSEKDVPPARPSMNTREEALKAAARKDGEQPAPATPDQSDTAADTDADAEALNAAVAEADSAQPAAKAPRKR